MRLLATLVLLALALSGCATRTTATAARPDVDPATTTQQLAVAAVTGALEDAAAAAKLYGRQHLGHYRKLNHARLREAGYEPTEDVTLAIYVTHTQYCITATHAGLAQDDPWRTASIDSTQRAAAAGDGCAEHVQAREGAQVNARDPDQAWVCRLPGADA